MLLFLPLHDLPTIGSIMAVVAVLLMNIESIHVQIPAPNISSASPRPVTNTL